MRKKGEGGKGERGVSCSDFPFFPFPVFPYYASGLENSQPIVSAANG
jgi:hypothetical protein